MSDQEIMGRKGYRFTVFLARKRIDRKDSVRFVPREPLFAKKESQAKEIISTEGGYYVPFKIDSDGYTVWDVSKYVKFTGDEAKDMAELLSLYRKPRESPFKFLYYELESDQVIESNGVQYTGSDAQDFIKSGGYKPNGSLTDTYPFFVVVDDVVVSGWDYKEDAKEHASEIKEDLGFSSKVYTKKTVKSRGFEEADLEVVRERRRTAAKGYEPNHGFEEEKMEYVFHTKSDASRFRGALDRSDIRLQGKPSTRKTKPEFRHGGSPGYSVHFKGLGLEDTYEAVGLAKSMGGREYGLNFGTPEYREWASSKGPYEPNSGDSIKYKDIKLGARVNTPQGPGKIVGYPGVFATFKKYYEGPWSHAGGRGSVDPYHRDIEVRLDTAKPGAGYRVYIVDASDVTLAAKGYEPNSGDSHLDDMIDKRKLLPLLSALRKSDPSSVAMLRDSYKRLRELTTLKQNERYALTKFVNLVNEFDPDRGLTVMDGNSIYKIHDSLGLGKFAANSPDFYRQSGLSKSDTDMLRHLAENRRHNIPVLSGGREEFESWERKAIGSLLKKKYLSRYEITIGGDDGWGVSLTTKGHKKAQSLDELWDNIIS